jgi:N6-L-threonylcarbamoyladenine synthase
MEGHIYSVLIDETVSEKQAFGYKLAFPTLALLISGGHTELVLVKSWREYELLGQTRDDAVGEAFDKTARVLGLPYPGGPQVSKLAKQARDNDLKLEASLPRPMINSNNLDFSFSGLKTAVLYYEKEHRPLDEDHKKMLAREIEDSICEVLVSKTRRALSETGVRTLIIGGGVIANEHLRKEFEDMISKESPSVTLMIPSKLLSTDNAVMIGIASYFRFLSGEVKERVVAQGNLKLGAL